jgi:hypothetical protein
VHTRIGGYRYLNGAHAARLVEALIVSCHFSDNPEHVRYVADHIGVPAASKGLFLDIQDTPAGR